MLRQQLNKELRNFVQIKAVKIEQEDIQFILINVAMVIIIKYGHINLIKL